MTKQTFDPGLTTQVDGQLRRVINKDGSFNVRRSGTRYRDFNFYLFLIDSSWPQFIGVVLAAYLLVNIGFAFLFITAGIEHLSGAQTNTGMGPFASAFFFSVHTLTTVGYGSVYPTGPAANAIAGFEAMAGLMGFALATGLLYGRFSRPSARIVFSEHMLVAPYQEITSLQFRVANARDNIIMELEAKVLMMYTDRSGSEPRRLFQALDLERPSVYFFPLTWTVVHPIAPESPLHGKTAEDLASLEAEFLILVKGFDGTFSQTVHARYSYRHDELHWGSRFQPAFHVDPKGDLILELNHVHDHKAVT